MRACVASGAVEPELEQGFKLGSGLSRLPLTRPSVHLWMMDKQKMVHPSSGVLLRHKEEGSFDMLQLR